MGYIYLICDPSNNAYKIGVTRDLESNRIKKLQTGNPSELHIVTTYFCEYPFRLETMLHNYFKNKQILNEWYDLTNYEISHFKEFCDKQNNIIKLLNDNEFFMNNIR